MPIKWHQQCQYSLKPLLNLLMRDRLLICRFCQQQIFTPTWLTMTIIKISRLKPLVCPKLLSLSKKPVKPIPIRSWWTVGIWFKELLLELIRPWLILLPKVRLTLCTRLLRCLVTMLKRLEITSLTMASNFWIAWLRPLGLTLSMLMCAMLRQVTTITIPIRLLIRPLPIRMANR